MIAWHYAEPVQRVVAAEVPLMAEPKDEAAALGPLESGEPFALLDDTLGWAWGYAGDERRVGYVRSDALRVP